MSKYANITVQKRAAKSTTTPDSSSSSETIIGNPFSDNAVTSTRCSSLQTLKSDCGSSKTVIVHRRSISISEFTLPFQYVDSLDLYRSHQPKCATIKRKFRKFWKKILPKSSEAPARVCHRNTKGDIDQLEVSSDHEEIRAEVDTLVRNFSLRFGLEVRERTESYEATRAVIRAEMAEERKRREARKTVRFGRC